jgi:hypothetical protein
MGGALIMKKQVTVKSFCGVDSFYRRPDGTVLSHEEVFSTVVNAIGLDVCKKYVPATKQEVETALENGDYHLNSIPLIKWDARHSHLASELLRIGINTFSRSDTVCILKQAARMWAAQNN